MDRVLGVRGQTSLQGDSIHLAVVSVYARVLTSADGTALRSRSASEQIVEQEDGVTHQNLAVIVGISQCIGIRLGPASEKVIQQENRIGHIDHAV